MSIVTVKAAVITALRTLTSPGTVEGREGRTSGFPWDDTTRKDTQPLWTVKLKRSGIAPEEYAITLGQKTFEHVWNIRFYFPWNFEANSEGVVDSYIDQVMTLLKSDPAISVCVRSKTPTVLENDYVKFRTGTEELLCHFVLFEFKTQEWVST
jgi:hypothetical protein